MSARLLLAMLEPQEKVLFAGGLVMASRLSAGETFTAVYAYKGSKTSRKKQADIALTVQTLIVDGEPVTAAEDGTDVLVALSGNSEALIEAAAGIGWTRKRGRYLRSGQYALTLDS